MAEIAETQALEAYERFFTNFNTRNAETFTAALQFPHVRVSPRRTPQVIELPETHISNQSWEPFIATGWDHSTGKPGEVLHFGENKAHVLGGWTRYTADEKPILSNTVAYIVTQYAGRWGIQARFGIDAGNDGDTTEHYASAVEAVETYLEAYNQRNWESCAEPMNYPTLQIDPGYVGRWESQGDFAKALEEGAWQAISAHEARAVQGGSNAVNVALEVLLQGGQRQQALFCVTLRDEHWGIQARSIITK